MKLNLILIVITVGFFSLNSCKKDEKIEPNGQNVPSDPTNPNNPVIPVDPTDPIPGTPTGTLLMHLHTYLEDQEVDLYNIDYTTSEGRTISLSTAQLYLSDIQLVRLDGSTYDVGSKKILKVFEAESYLIGEVPVGNYKTIKFKVGVDPTTNSQSPNLSTDSVILNKPSMWFNSSSQPDGYVFMNFQGKIDTSSTLAETPVPFRYKIGTNANRVQITMPDKSFTVLKDQIVYSHILIDYYRLFNGIQLNQFNNLSVLTASDNSASIAAIIKNNISSIFIYEL
jgi:hypothetical protein